MPKNRRDFIKMSSLAYLGLSSNLSFNTMEPESNVSLIGKYGQWANKRMANKIPSLSFRNAQFKDVEAWKKLTKSKIKERIGYQKITEKIKVETLEVKEYDGLHVEKLQWTLPYGDITEAVFLKPIGAKGKLPGILALHDHGGNKYFGTRKICQTDDAPHPMMKSHREEYYEGKAWANEAAKQGYAVLVFDTFAFGSRRVLLEDVPQRIKEGVSEVGKDELQKDIDSYNEWASAHESIMARSLFSAGTSWPAVFLAEDQVALDILSARSDVDAANIGCCGLSGGGLRSVYLGAMDTRIKCAVPVGFMTTWSDFVLYKSFTHTWMIYIPILPNELDFPDVMSVRAPLPTLVLNDIDDNLFTISEMKKAEAILRSVYKKAGASEKFACSFHPGPHKFDQKMQAEAFAWFDRWLKK